VFKKGEKMIAFTVEQVLQLRQVIDILLEEINGKH
jgi:hypothetical protein